MTTEETTQTQDPAAELQRLTAMSEKERNAEISRLATEEGYKAVAAFARKLDQADKAKEKAELDAKRAALDAVKDTVSKAITEAVKPIVDSGQLDVADGIWFSYDFGEQAPVVRLMKSAPRAARSGGGGGGRKFEVSTEDMLGRHGEEEYKDGMNFSQAWESSTDKNWRYAIRTKLLKLEGVI